MKTKTKTKPRRAKPRKVDPALYDEDLLCLVYAEYGFTTNFICSELGLSPSQVNYRIKVLGGVGQRAEFRNGRNDQAARVVDMANRSTKRKR